MKLCIADIVSATKGNLICGDLNGAITKVSTDTRAIEPGSFFVAMKGETFDAHQFLGQAKDKGAVGCLVEQDVDASIQTDAFAVIRVENTRIGLAQIAGAYRRMFEGRVCAITGSVGKTSTKDMIAAVLSKSFSVQKTQGNFNNEIGMPLTVLGLQEYHTALVTEMGMRGFGEIDFLANIAKPDVGVITNIGVSHIERLGSQENICKAKMEMIPHIKQGGTLVVNGDDPWLNEIQPPEHVTIMRFGIENEDADVRAKNIEISEDGQSTTFELYVKNMPLEIYMAKVPVPGVHHVYNALCAVCVGLQFQMSISDMIDGIGDFSPSGMRQQITISPSGVRVINDAYNASPDSMKASIHMLSNMPCSGKKIAVLGDMFELGENSSAYHMQVGTYLKNTDISHVVTVGDLARYIGMAVEEKQVIHFDTKEDASAYISSLAKEGDCVLIKASRGMKLEEIAAVLQER